MNLKECMLCPRMCKVNRYKTVGFCKANAKMKVALASIHHYEEPCISGTRGSGTIFFSNCNLKCIFCQNKKISKGYGKEISIKRFREIVLDLQDKKVHNINLVTPTHYVPLIKKGLKKIKNKELFIPVIYNTSSYENVDTIKDLNGLIDIYLADLKYYSNNLSKKYSLCDDYFKYATLAIDEMYKQVGSPIFDKDNIMIKGIIVRVLLLPECFDDAKKIIKYLYDTYKDNIFISIMNQYTPTEKYKYKELNKTINDNDYNDIIDYAYDLGIRNCFIQEGKTCLESFIPNFNKDGV